MFGKGLGLWNIKVDGSNFDLKPTLGDVRAFRNILFNNTKNQVNLFNEFEKFMVRMISTEYQDQDKEKIEEFVALNTMTLFTEAQIAFKFTTREELEKSKSEIEGKIKNSM